MPHRDFDGEAELDRIQAMTDEPTERQIKTRQAAAGRFGFTLGCIAAVLALVLNLYRAPRPLGVMTVVLAVLMAALNIPLGIAFGLLGERLSRGRRRR